MHAGRQAGRHYPSYTGTNIKQQTACSAIVRTTKEDVRPGKMKWKKMKRRTEQLSVNGKGKKGGIMERTN